MNGSRIKIRPRWVDDSQTDVLTYLSDLGGVLHGSNAVTDLLHAAGHLHMKITKLEAIKETWPNRSSAIDIIAIPCVCCAAGFG